MFLLIQFSFLLWAPLVFIPSPVCACMGYVRLMYPSSHHRLTYVVSILPGLVQTGLRFMTVSFLWPMARVWQDEIIIIFFLFLKIILARTIPQLLSFLAFWWESLNFSQIWVTGFRLDFRNFSFPGFVLQFLSNTVLLASPSVSNLMDASKSSLNAWFCSSISATFLFLVALFAESNFWVGPLMVEVFRLEIWNSREEETFNLLLPKK